MQPSRDVQRLKEIMRALRAPGTGCPWDLEQSFETIVPYTIEEAYEVADAIERRDAVDLREELGDLLLQVVYHAQLAEEAGLFAFEDVVETVTRKMIRRHPHVFGDAEARSARSAKGQWERIKVEEKRERAEARAALRDQGQVGTQASWTAPAPVGTGLLDTVPGAMPSLMLAQKVQAQAAKVGFDWTEMPPILEKLREETDEFAEAVATGDPAAMRDELGDILFTAVNLARRADADADAALRGTVAKFRHRFAAMERAAAHDGRDLAALTLDEQEALWVAAKCSAAAAPPAIHGEPATVP